MSEHDHFSNVLDVEAHEQPHQHRFDGGEHEHDDDDYGDSRAVESNVPKKKSIPTPILIVGGMVAFIVLGAGYQHFFGAKPQSALSPSSAADAGETAGAGSGGGQPAFPVSPPSQGGMLAAPGAGTPPPLPAQMPPPASNPPGPAPSADSYQTAAASPAVAAQPTSMPGSAARAAPSGPFDGNASPATGNTPSAMPAFASASAVPAGAAAMIGGSDSSSSPSAAVSVNPASAPDQKDLEIAKLQAELKAAKAHGHGGPRPMSRRIARMQHAAPRGDAASEGAAASAAAADANIANNAGTATEANADAASAVRPAKAISSAHRARHDQRHKQARVEPLLGYHIKQVIPGQGWVEDEQTGKQQVVAVGDKIGRAEVIKIDPDNYRIDTTAGVIQ